MTTIFKVSIQPYEIAAPASQVWSCASTKGEEDQYRQINLMLREDHARAGHICRWQWSRSFITEGSFLARHGFMNPELRFLLIAPKSSEVFRKTMPESLTFVPNSSWVHAIPSIFNHVSSPATFLLGSHAQSFRISVNNRGGAHRSSFRVSRV